MLENDYILSAVSIWCLVSTIWIVSVVKTNASIIDPWWSMTILLSGTISLVRHDLNPEKLFLTGLASLWALRLWFYLLRRGWGEEEDSRYQAFRKRFGPERYWWFSYFQVFMLQGSLAFVVSLPLQINSRVGDVLAWNDYLGGFIFLLGFFWEVVGDHQLKVFKANPENRGKVMDQGLWRYSRHPNYFGEVLLWWGLWICVVDDPGGLYTVISPLIITFLLLKVSGVTMLEEQLMVTKPGFREYVDRTPAFIPGRPKPDKSD